MREPTPTILREATQRPRHFLDDRMVSGRLPDASINNENQGLRDSWPEAKSQQLDIFRRSDGPRPAHWTMCWSDLMMTMFIMFAFLYIFQMPRIAPQPDPDTPRVEPVHVRVPVTRQDAGSLLDRVHDQVHALIERKGLDSLMAVQFVPGKSLHVVFRGDLFGSGSDMPLSPVFAAALIDLAEILRTAPYTLAVVGHSDPGENVQGHAGPWGLAASRAARAAGMLVAEGRLPADRIYVVGYGDQRPDAGAAPGVGRVELVLSAENPTEPRSEAPRAAADGYRQWLSRSTQEGR